MANLNNWLEGNDKDDLPFDPEKFDPVNVRFDNPKNAGKWLFAERDENKNGKRSHKASNADLMRRTRDADSIGARHISRCQMHDCIRSLSH